MHEAWSLPDSDFVKSCSGDRFSADERKRILDGRKHKQTPSCPLKRTVAIQVSSSATAWDKTWRQYTSSWSKREIQMHVPPKCVELLDRASLRSDSERISLSRSQESWLARAVTPDKNSEFEIWCVQVKRRTEFDDLVRTV